MADYLRKIGVRMFIAAAVVMGGLLPLPISFLSPQAAYAGCFGTAITPTKSTQGPGYLNYGGKATCNPIARTTLNVYLNKWNGGNMLWVTSGSFTTTSNFTYYPNSYNCNYQTITRDWVTVANTDGGVNNTSFTASLTCS